MRWIAFPLVFLAPFAAANPTFIEKLDGLAAQCSIDGGGKYIEVELALRDHGEQSSEFKSRLKEAYRIAQSCVNKNLPKGKEALRTEVTEVPQLKDRLADTYAAWLSYMNWLRTPHSWGTDSAEKSGYESARNRLQAEIDIR